MRKKNSMKIVAAIILLFVISSCNEDPYNKLLEHNGLQKESRALSGEERAVQAFKEFLSGLEDKTVTRGATTCKVMKVEKKSTASYSGSIPTTRALGLSLPVYELTVQNDDDNTTGFAVVTECPNESRVMAYSPMGSIADTTFNKGLATFFRDFSEYTEYMMGNIEVKTRVDFEVFQDYNIYDFLVSSNFVRNPTQEEINSNFSGYPYETEKTTEKVGQFVSAMWDQGSPYNDKVPKFRIGTNERVRVGCVPVAIGQLLSYYKEYRNYDWKLLTATAKISPNTPAANEVSRLLMDIALEAKIDHDPETNFGNTLESMIGPTLKLFGFTNCKIVNSTRDPFRDYIYNDVKDNHPVLVVGVGYTGGPNNCHVWISDRMWITEKYRYFIHGNQVHRSLYQANHVHCNWGWGNRSDGWYHTFTPVYIDGKKYNLSSEVKVYYHLYNE